MAGTGTGEGKIRPEEKEQVMNLTFWGTRGSIAVPGSGTVRYGGNTPCIQIVLNNGREVLVDAGTGIRLLGLELAARKAPLSLNLIFTHPHWDHIQGFPFFDPAYIDGNTITVLGCPGANLKVHNILTSQMEGTYFPVNFEQLKATILFEEVCGTTLEMEGATIRFIRTNHPVVCQGLRIDEGDRSLVFITDNELDAKINVNTMWEEFVEFCKGADVLIHDAQYTEEELETHRGWGHSCAERVVDLAVESAVKTVVLYHHDPGRTDEMVDAMVAASEEKLKRKGVSIKCFGAREGYRIDPRDGLLVAR